MLCLYEMQERLLERRLTVQGKGSLSMRHDTSPGGQLWDQKVKQEERARKVNPNPTGQGGGSYRRKTVNLGIRKGLVHKRLPEE